MSLHDCGRVMRTSGPSSIDPGQVHAVLRQYILADGFPLVFDLERSHGSWIVDARTGGEYLDFFSFFASLPVGYNHPALHSEAWEKRLLRAAIHKPSSSDAYTEEMAGFVQTFSEIALPAGFHHLFFIEGGTLGVENALKAAFDWKVRKVRSRGGDLPDPAVLHFREAFHGRSGYTLSLTNTDPVKTDLYPKFDWPRVRNPKIRFPLTPQEKLRVAVEERSALEEIEEAFRRHPDRIAAIIIETIQGEGGDNHFRGAFLRALREAADRHEAMLVFDEVQCGFGMTGRMWAWEHFDAVPDMIAFGKKSQVCGFMATDRIDEVPDNVFKVSSRLNSTWGGNLVDMVRCEAYLRILEAEDLIGNAARTGAVLLAGLQEVARRVPGIIDNVRGRGLLCAFDATDPTARRDIIQAAFDERLVVLSCGQKSIRLRPPLTLSPDEVAEGMDRLERALVRMRMA